MFENLVAKQSICKRLEDLGMKEETLFCWTKWKDEVFVSRSEEEAAPEEVFLGRAYTINDLLERLPSNTNASTGLVTLMIEVTPDGWRVAYVDDNYMIADLLVEEEERLVDAIAKMCVRFLESKWI